MLYPVLQDIWGWGLAPCASFCSQGETLLQEQTPGAVAESKGSWTQNSELLWEMVAMPHLAWVFAASSVIQCLNTDLYQDRKRIKTFADFLKFPEKN